MLFPECIGSDCTGGVIVSLLNMGICMKESEDIFKALNYSAIIFLVFDGLMQR